MIGPGRLKKILFKTPLAEIFHGRKFVFHHLHKCGGTSLKKSLEEFFILKKDYAVDGEPPTDFNRLLSCDLLVGHFELKETELFKRYPQVLQEEVFLFSMVREPLELKVSLYYYWKKHHRIQDETLKDFLLSKENYMSNLLYCNKDNWEINLRKYDFIGVLEMYEESLFILSELTDRKFKNYRKENSSKRDHQFDELSSNDQFIQKFKDLNKLDYTIYDWVVKKFKDQYQSLNSKKV